MGRGFGEEGPPEEDGPGAAVEAGAGSSRAVGVTAGGMGGFTGALEARPAPVAADEAAVWTEGPPEEGGPGAVGGVYRCP